MIRFEGKVSDRVRSYTIKKLFKVCVPIAIGTFVVGAFPFIVDPHYSLFKVAFALVCAIVGVMWAFFPFITLGLNLFQKVEIEDGVIDCVSLDKKSHLKSVEDVKKVIDMGSCYYIKFYFPPEIATCFCQKDLLVEGTIEEFEKLFEGKIVRKTK